MELFIDVYARVAAGGITQTHASGACYQGYADIQNPCNAYSSAQRIRRPAAATSAGAIVSAWQERSEVHFLASVPLCASTTREHQCNMTLLARKRRREDSSLQSCLAFDKARIKSCDTSKRWSTAGL